VKFRYFGYVVTGDAEGEIADAVREAEGVVGRCGASGRSEGERAPGARDAGGISAGDGGEAMTPNVIKLEKKDVLTAALLYVKYPLSTYKSNDHSGFSNVGCLIQSLISIQTCDKSNFS
jgi:hypothetical protein